MIATTQRHLKNHPELDGHGTKRNSAAAEHIFCTLLAGSLIHPAFNIGLGIIQNKQTAASDKCLILIEGRVTYSDDRDNFRRRTVIDAQGGLHVLNVVLGHHEQLGIITTRSGRPAGAVGTAGKVSYLQHLINRTVHDRGAGTDNEAIAIQRSAGRNGQLVAGAVQAQPCMAAHGAAGILLTNLVTLTVDVYFAITDHGRSGCQIQGVVNRGGSGGCLLTVGKRTEAARITIAEGQQQLTVGRDDIGNLAVTVRIRYVGAHAVLGNFRRQGGRATRCLGDVVHGNGDLIVGRCGGRCSSKGILPVIVVCGTNPEHRVIAWCAEGINRGVAG